MVVGAGSWPGWGIVIPSSQLGTFSVLDLTLYKHKGIVGLVSRGTFSAESSAADSILQSQEAGSSPFGLPEDAEGSVCTEDQLILSGDGLGALST